VVWRPELKLVVYDDPLGSLTTVKLEVVMSLSYCFLCGEPFAVYPIVFHACAVDRVQVVVGCMPLRLRYGALVTSELDQYCGSLWLGQVDWSGVCGWLCV
jgi:hypothetical protein